MSSSNCCFLTCIQVSQEAGQVIWYSHLFQNFPQFIVIHTIKGFGIVNKAEIDVFLELCCFFDDPADVGNLNSGPSAFSKTSLNIWKVTVHVLWKTGLENFEYYFISVWYECSFLVVWAFFGIVFLRYNTLFNRISLKGFACEPLYKILSEYKKWESLDTEDTPRTGIRSDCDSLINTNGETRERKLNGITLNNDT